MGDRKKRKIHLQMSGGVTCSLAPVLLHAEDLDHPDKDVDKVKLEADRLGKGVAADHAGTSHLGVLQDALRVVEHEGTKDGKTTVERDGLGSGKGTEGSTRKEHGCERGECHNRDTGKQRATHPEELVVLSSGTHVAETADQTSRVKGSARKDGRVEEEQWAQYSCLRRVEEQPRRNLQWVARRERGGAKHTTNTGNQSNT